MTLRTLLLLAVAVLGVTTACGDDGPPVCPTGNCNLPGSTIVKWKFNNYPEWKFESDACSDVGAIMVRVTVTQVDDPLNVLFTEKSCGEGQATFIDLLPGTYNVAVDPLDIDGGIIVRAPGTGTVLAGSSGANTEVTVNVPHTAWLQAYTGQFLYRISWGGPTTSCAMALPMPVVEQVVTLTAGGVVRTETALVDNVPFQRLDGTDPKPCAPYTAPFPQNVMGLPFGPATLLVVGKDAVGGNVIFRTQFDTFIGAGVFNPTLSFDVQPGT